MRFKFTEPRGPRLSSRRARAAYKSESNMILFAQQFLICFALALSPACMRADEASTAPGSNTVSFETAEAVVLSTEDQGEGALAVTRRMDKAERDGDAQVPRLSPQEHMRRAGVYHANRAFDEARSHWRAVIERHPDDANVPAAHFGIGRSLFQERRYEEALPVFHKLGDTYPGTEAGRDGFYYVAATLLRMDRPGEAAARYAEYAEKFPQGERVENAYLNTIDSLREAGRPGDAIPWIERTRARFAGKPAATSALFARLRLDVARKDWRSALSAAEELSRARLTREVNTTSAEIEYLRAHSLEGAGRKEQAIKAYEAIADGLGSYYGGRATERLRKLGGEALASALRREERVRDEARRASGNYPAPFRDALLRASKEHSVDPRFMLAVMRQESGFNPRAKSPAAARGLLQLIPEVAEKYAPAAKLSKVSEEDLYRPEVNIRLAAAYMADLNRMFPKLPEAVAASYNGGEESVARWVRRAAHDDPGIVTSEVGFTETKDYVNKVMQNYRAYKLLYDEDLTRRR